MKKVSLLLGILSVVVILFSGGCQDTIDQPNDGQGHLVIKLTDAPFPIDMIDSAMVHITKVEIRKVSEGEEDVYPFITVFEGYESFNLLDLRNGVTADLVDVKIEAGSYDLIRLYVDEVGLSVKDSETSYSLKVPSGAQTGIKIFLEPAVEVAGQITTDVTLDVDLEKSFILKGNTKTPAGIKGFNFKPVIRAVNNTTAGTIQGFVTNSDTALHKASVWIVQDTVVSSAFTDTAGFYAMTTIPAGTYSVSAKLDGFDSVFFEDVKIIAGNLTIQDFILPLLEEDEVEE